VDAIEFIINNSVTNQSRTLSQLESRSLDAFNKMNVFSARCKSKGIYKFKKYRRIFFKINIIFNDPFIELYHFNLYM